MKGTRTLYCLNLCFFCILSIVSRHSYAQNLQAYSGDTVLLGKYRGIEQFSFISDSDGKRIRHGRYAFRSELIPELDKGNLMFKELSVTGSFKEEKKYGQWIYALTDYDVDITNVLKGTPARLQYTLNGNESRYLMSFAMGMPEGKWELRKRNISEGRYLNEKVTSTLFFKEGLFVKECRASFSDSLYGQVEIQANANSEGYWNGSMHLEYQDDAGRIRELRQYHNGFLLSIKKTLVETDSVLLELRYSDVDSIIRQLQGNPEGLNIGLSESGFGVLFNHGYDANDIRVVEQFHGNTILEKALHVYHPFIFLSRSTRKPRYNLTRRFKYMYPQSDAMQLSELKPKALKLQDTLQKFLNTPRYVLRKGTSDSLALAYAQIEYANSRLEIINDFIEKHDSGFFDLTNRDLYYRNGILGLHKPDTFRYVYKLDTLFAHFNSGTWVTYPQAIIQSVYAYLEALEQYTRRWIEYSDASILFFNEQDKLDLLESKVVKRLHEMEAGYSHLDTEYVFADDKDKPFVYKIYRSTKNRLMLPLEQRFKSDVSFSGKMESGTEWLCLMELLVEEHNFIKFIDTLPRYFNDSLFTVYQVNPFDNRSMQSKILGNIQRAGNRLLNYYIDEMLRANSCKVLEAKLTKVKQLRRKLELFAAYQESDEMKALNRVIRRETVPSRIERLFDL
jgi:hypothetical protein